MRGDGLGAGGGVGAVGIGDVGGLAPPIEVCALAHPNGAIANRMIAVATARKLAKGRTARMPK